MLKEASVVIKLDKRYKYKNGNFCVSILVTFQRKPRFFSTGVSMSEKEFSEYHIKKNLREKYEKITYFHEKAINICKKLGEDFVFKKFKDAFFNIELIETHENDKISPIPVLSYMENYILKYKEEGKIRTYVSYVSLTKHLKSYLDAKKIKSDFTFFDIDASMLKDFDNFLLKKKLSLSTIGIYLRNLRAIYNSAISDKIISSDLYPFGKNGYTPPTTKKAKKALKLEDIQKLYNYHSANPKEEWAKDMFLFSYFANGLNMKDILLLKQSNIANNFLHVTRAKTLNKMRVNPILIKIFISPEMDIIMNKWGNLSKNNKDYIFPILDKFKKPTSLDIFKTVNQTIKTINKYLKRIAVEIDLSRVPTSNFARHTFATVMKNSGAPLAMISSQLGHSQLSTTQIYFSEFEDDQLIEATKYLTAFKTDNK